MLVVVGDWSSDPVCCDWQFNSGLLGRNSDSQNSQMASMAMTGQSDISCHDS